MTLETNIAKQLRQQASTTTNTITEYLSNPTKNGYTEATNQLTQLIHNTTLITTATGSTSYIGLNPTELTAIHTKLTSLRGNQARLDWLNTDPPTITTTPETTTTKKPKTPKTTDTTEHTENTENTQQ